MAALALLCACQKGPAAETDQRRAEAPRGLSARFYAPRGWAFGEIAVDGRRIRYGVVAPAVASRADVVILPDRPTTVEGWFETAADLSASAAVNVWVLDGIEDPQKARAALETMTRRVARPHRARKLILLGEGFGATELAGALIAGQGADGAVLASPRLEIARVGDRWSPEQLEAAGAWTARWHLGMAPLPWPIDRVTGPVDPLRARAQEAWGGGAKAGWTTLSAIDAFDRAVRQARSNGALKAARVPVLVTAGGGAAARANTLCASLPACTFRRYGVGGAASYLQADSVRLQWLADVKAYIAARTAGEPVAAP